MSGHRLDVPALHQALDKQRQTRGLSWRQVARECGLAASTLTRLDDGHAPDAHSLVSMLVWLGLDTAIAHLVRPGPGP